MVDSAPTKNKHRDQVGTLQVLESVVGHQLGADAGAQRPARHRTADLEVEVRHPVVGSVDTEHFAEDTELEHRKVIEYQH